MEQALVDHLLADAGLADVVGTRVNWLLRPQGAPLPAVVLTLVAGRPEYTLAGLEGLSSSLVQVDAWAGDYPTMKAAQAALTAALDAAAGAGSGEIRAVFVEAIRETAERLDGPTAAGATEVFRVSIDARVWHAPAA